MQNTPLVIVVALLTVGLAGVCVHYRRQTSKGLGRGTGGIDSVKRGSCLSYTGRHTWHRVRTIVGPTLRCSSCLRTQDQVNADNAKARAGKR